MNEKYPLALPEGTVLAGQYIIEKVLGQGGFGITYEAMDYKTSDKVAVKEFFPDAMATRTGRTTVMPFSGERGESYDYGKTCFLQEAETLAKFIGNENIVRIHSYFEENGTAYFVMDFIEGTSFDEYLKQRGGKIPFEEAVKILIPIMDALGAVHSRGIVHRDVTPDNIYITKEGIVKLLDFGAARYSLGDKSRSLDVVLKHGFAPKEQYTRRGRQGPYTDIYALGATFYFALTGKRPPDSVERLDEDELIPPSALGVRISPEAEDAILTALNVQPGDRFQSMTAFKNAMLNVSQMGKSPASDQQTPAVEQRFFTPPESPAPAVSPVQNPAPAICPAEGIMENNTAGNGTVSRKNAAGKKKWYIGAAVAAAVLCVGILVVVFRKGDAEPSSSLSRREQESQTYTTPEPTRESGPRSTAEPTQEPVPEPTQEPTPEPTQEPTPEPTQEPTPQPTAVPSGNFTLLGNSAGNLMNLGLRILWREKDCFVTDSGHAVWWNDDYLFQEEEGTFSHLSAEGDKLFFLYDKIAFVWDGSSEELNGIDYLNDLYAGKIECLMVTKDYYVVCCADTDANSIYRVSRTDGESKLCCKVKSNNKFTLSSDGWIYYVASEDNISGIYRKRLDTLERDENRLIYMVSEQENYSFCSPVIVGNYLYCINYNADDPYEYSIIRMPKDTGYNSDCPVWTISEELNIGVNGGRDWCDSTGGFLLNVNETNQEIYLNCFQSEDGMPYLYRMKGYEDGTYNIELMYKGAFCPNMSYFENGDYNVFYFQCETNEDGNINLDGDFTLYYSKYNAEGSNITPQ